MPTSNTQISTSLPRLKFEDLDAEEPPRFWRRLTYPGACDSTAGRHTVILLMIIVIARVILVLLVVILVVMVMIAFIKIVVIIVIIVVFSRDEFLAARVRVQ